METPTVPRPLVIGHRGFRARFPENTVSAACAALGVGADGVEVDVRLTRDRRWVCHHDRTRGGVAVADRSLAELRREGVDPLAEVVSALAPRHWLFVELKPLAGAALEAGLAELAALLGDRPRVRLLSSSPRVLRLAGEALPLATPSLVVRRLPHRRVAAGWSLSPHHTLVERLLHRPESLHPWTVNGAARLRALDAAGVASITTDDPETALAVLAR